MTTFDKREQAAENKYVHDAELKFKIVNRRNKLAGLWAAEKMRMDAQDAKNYAEKLVEAHLTHASADAIATAISTDFAKHGLDIFIEDVAAQLIELENVAKGEIVSS